MSTLRLQRRCLVVSLFSLGAILFLASVSLFGQANTGRILGTITDQTGGAIPNAGVTVTNVQTGVTRSLTADSAGEYAAPNLIPGTYSVHVAVMGFKTTDRENILLETGRDVRVDVQLAPGEITQTVEVTEAVPLVDTTSVTIGGTLSNQVINDLPVNGRNYTNLLILRPGVMITPGGGSLTQTTNGMRPEDNNFVIEGLDSNDAFSGQSITNSTLPSGDAATILPIDAIQEFNTEVNAPAEFGRKPGAVINVALKSGTNTLHGTAYAFGRSDAWGARNFFNPPPPPGSPAGFGLKAPLEFEQFGASAGGHIVKDKLFYFGAFEQQRYTAGQFDARQILSTSSFAGGPAASLGATGSLPDATAALQAKCAAGGAGANFNGCSGGTFTINPISQALLPYFGTNTTNALTVNGYGFPNIVQTNNAVGKVDYDLNSKHSFHGAYFFGNGTSTSEDADRTEAIFRSVGRLRSQFVTSNWTWIPNSNWVNTARVGWTYYNRPVFPFDHNTPPTAYGINTGVTNPFVYGMPGITVAGLRPSVGAGTNWPNPRGPNSNYDFVDQVSYLRGKHAFKFGGEALISRVYNGPENNARGSFSFAGKQAFKGSTGLEDFLAGVPKSAKILVGSPGRHVSQELYAGFFQDAWRLTSKVTLNLGLRYDYDTVLKVQDNLIGNFSPTAGLEQVGTNISSPYNGYHKDIAPHVGVAWDLTGKGTTVFRAGGSLIFDDIPITEFIYHVGFTDVGMTYNPTGNTLVLANGTVLPPVNPTGGLAFIGDTVPGSQLNWINSTTQVFPTNLTSAFTCGNGIQVDPTKAVSALNPLNPSPCEAFGANPNLKNPYVGTWTVSLQHAFTNNVSLEAAYVGNHAGNLTGVLDLNEPPFGAGGAGCTLPASGGANTALNCEQVARPFYNQFPYIGAVAYLDSVYRSNYHGLQTTLTTRNYHNLSVVVGYTYSHALDDSSHYFASNFPQDSRHPDADYGASDFDVRHHFTLSSTYNLPGKKGRAQMLEGWQLNSIVHLQSGLPWGAVDAGDDLSQTDQLADRWDLFGNPKDFTTGRQDLVTGIPFYPGGAANMPSVCTNAANANGLQASLAQFGCYSQGNSALIAPALGTFGTSSRNMFRADHFRNWDVSIFKIWTVNERFSAQFRAEFFNILNIADFYPPAGDPSGGGFGCLCKTPDVGSTNPNLGTGGPRAIELGLKLGF
jgi:Carboxypeptidase regulatory-like domain/TonB dependent receptor